MTNPSVATMEPALGGGRTEQLPIPKGAANPPSDLWAVSPTVIEPALQWNQRGGPTSGPDMIAVPFTTPLPPVVLGTPLRRRWPLIAGAAVAVLMGLGAWSLLGPGPEPVVTVPPLKLNPPVPIKPLAIVDVVDATADPTADAGDEQALAPVDDPVRPKKRKPPPPKPGHVTVRVNPWAEVFFNGKSYGITPLKSPVEVPAGTATFTLKNSQLGVNKKVTVKVAAGAEVVLKADLFKK